MKKVISSFLVLAFLLSTFLTTSYAKSTDTLKIKSNDGRLVNFTIKEGLKPDIKVLQDIANDNPDTTNIEILDIGIAETAFLSELNDRSTTIDGVVGINSVPYPVPFTLTKNQIKSDVLESDRWMESCAKGQTKYISSSIEASLSPSYTGIAVGLTLNGTIKYTITTVTTLVGPPEDSPNNCREYRCKFYQNTGWWSQIWMWTDGLPHTFTGNYAEPSYYYSYSKDLYIS